MISTADTSQYLAGSNVLKHSPFYLKGCRLPGLSTNPIQVQVKGGSFYTAGDSISFSELSFDVLVDKDYNSYFELLDILYTQVNPEADSFADTSFDFWIQVNQEDLPLFKFEFHGVRISSLGDLELGNDVMTVSVSLVYDYYTYSRWVTETTCENGEQITRRVLTTPRRFTDGNDVQENRRSKIW